MVSLTTIFLSLSLLASQTLAVPNASVPSKHARWVQVPRTLQDPDFLKRDNLEGRGAADIGFSPLEKKDLFERQSTCNVGEVECRGDKCCPSGYNCYYVASEAACCRVGQTCSGAPVGCADPGSLECPASIGGCCPIGQACYRDSTGVARCDTTGEHSSSDVLTTPTFTSDPIITPTFTPTIPTFTPTTRTTQTTNGANVAGGQTTVASIRNGADRMAIGGVMTVLMGAFVVLA